MGKNKVTLQINVSPGDVLYAHITVPALIEQHTEVDKILLVVDTCKPGRTKITIPEIQFPEPMFSEKVKKIIDITTNICNQYSGTEMFVLEPNDPVIKTLGKKYLDDWYYNTHDYGGCANMAYWLGFDLPQTQYVAHYDADILLYQKEKYFWTEEAIQLMGKNKTVVASCPRHNTPFPTSYKIPSFNHGVPFRKVQGGWLDNWFSTRCLLIDKLRLQNYLPLLTGKILFETLAAKYFHRGYPRSPEVVLHRKIGSKKGYRLILNNFDSWIMHPHSKPEKYIKNLPAILELIQNGIFPKDHIGDNLELEKWLELIDSNSVLSKRSIKTITDTIF